jgi:hypothetical protein
LDLAEETGEEENENRTYSDYIAHFIQNFQAPLLYVTFLLFYLQISYFGEVLSAYNKRVFWQIGKNFISCRKKI